MKLGFIFDVRFTEYNGEYYSTNLTQEFWQSRYLEVFDEIVVVGRKTSVDFEPSGKLVRSDNEKVHFNCISDCNKIKRLLRQKEESKFIEQAIKDCDAVILRGWWGVKACKKLKKPYLVEVISCVWDSFWNHGAFGKMMAIPNFFVQRNAVKNAPYVVYVTERFLQKRYPTKGKSIGVSDVALKEDNSENVLNARIEKIKTNNGKYIIGTAAAVNVKYKGQRFVIKMLAELKRKGYNNFEYQLAGSGNKYKLEILAKKLGVLDNVKFIGPIPHDKIFDWLDSLDLYIQPSLQEGLPRAVVEAMSRGLPCVCLKTGGMPELVEDKYICSKKGNIPKTLMQKVLTIIDETEMVRCAEVNFARAKDFKSACLSEKRKKFYKEFAQDTLNK